MDKDLQAARQASTAPSAWKLPVQEHKDLQAACQTFAAPSTWKLPVHGQRFASGSPSFRSTISMNAACTW
jgi:hypothetical protein